MGILIRHLRFIRGLGTLACLLLFFPEFGAAQDRQASALPDNRVISDKRPTREILATRGSRKTRNTTQIIGDANNDGLFNGQDLAYVRSALRHNQNIRTTMADVALPCNGRLEPNDGRRIMAALYERRTSKKVNSRCHLQNIGEQWTPPAPRTLPPLVTLDDMFVSVARSAPGFGGLYIGPDGALNVVLVDPDAESLKAAKRAIDRVFGADRFRDSAVNAVSGDYNFILLKSWKDSSLSLFELGGVVSLDADERSNRVRIGIEDSKQRRAVESALKKLGVPLDAVSIHSAERMRFENHLLIPSLQNERRPLRAGMQIAVPSVPCTLGFIAKWYGEARGVVTNTHCSGTFEAPNIFNPTVASNAFQPMSVPDESTKIGREALDPQWQCAPNRCRQSDSTFIELDPGITGYLGLAGRSSHEYPHSVLYKILGKATAVCGETAHLIGHATGEDAGEVESTCVSVGGPTNLPPGWPLGDLSFHCQTTYEADSTSGDSGGPVLQVINAPSDKANLLGIHSGRRSIAGDEEGVYSPIANIESEIGVLDVAYGNEPPEILITSPADGSKIGPGAFPVVKLEAQVFDFEGGGDCATCDTSWYSGKNGPLGVTPWANGVSGHTVTLGGGQGYHAITATAKDAEHKTAFDTVVVSTSNSPPNVWIDWPDTEFQELYIFFPYTFAGSSFDNEDFQAIDCAKLTWTVEPDLVGGSKTGCSVLFTFTGISTFGFQVTLTAEDDKGEIGEAKRMVYVTGAPANTGPIVNFTFPANNSAISLQQTTTLTVIGTDPDGQSPISYEWQMTRPGVTLPVTIGTTSGTSGAPSSIIWRAADHIPPNCGGTSVKVTVIATDPTNMTGQGELNLEILNPAC